MKDVFSNCLSVQETPHGFVASRFTAKQMDFYISQGQGAFDRAVNNAGVCLEFITGKAEISFDFYNRAFSRPFVCFDIFEDDIFVKPVKFEDETKSGTVLYKRKKAQPSKITIYLPCMAQTHISNISFGDYSAAKSEKKRLLALGDSVTQGMNGICPSQNYVAVLARNLGMDFINQGVGGQPYNALSFDAQMEYRPNIITVAFGANDFNIVESAEKIYENACEHLAKVREFAKNAPVFVISPVWRFDIEENKDLHEKATALNDFIRQAAEKSGFAYVRGLDMIPHDEMFFGTKNLHPCDLGFVNYGNNLAKTIVGALDGKDI